MVNYYSLNIKLQTLSRNYRIDTLEIQRSTRVRYVARTAALVVFGGGTELNLTNLYYISFGICGCLSYLFEILSRNT